MTLSAGTKVGAYEIVSLIGKGGMGEVYSARDPRLGREVAVKVLAESLLNDKNAFARFEQEARLLASLSHPNILTVYDVVSEPKQMYVVMELLKGETLRDRLKQGPLSLEQTISIGTAISDGLVTAHPRGIVHRDLKPENVFLTQDGSIKILDFGLAQIEQNYSSSPGDSERDTSPLLSRPGFIMGTVRSMAPEQLRGLTVDGRADLYALGCILYEMVSGRVPFESTDFPELTASILRDKPPPIEKSGIPKALVALIFRCLEKEPDLRFSSAQDVSAKLRSIPLTGHTQADAGSGKGRSKPKSVAILPLFHSGDDPEGEYLMDGITESIINTLSQLPRLKVTARSTAFRYKAKDVDPMEVGKALKAQMLMTGRGARRGDRLDIQVELVNAQDGSQVWGQHFSRNFSDIFLVQEEIATLISSALQRKLTGAEKKLLGKRYTENVEAYQHYLKGRYYWNRRTHEDLEKAIPFFQSAIETDPLYALAYTGIADCYNFLGWEPYGYSDPKVTFPRAISAATRALEIDENLAEAYNSLAWAKWAFHHDWDGAEQDYRRAIQLNPGYALAHVWYADLLAGCCRFDEALSEIRIAESLDPLAPIVYAVHGLILYFLRQYEESRKEHQKTLELQPDFSAAYFIPGRAYEMEKEYEKAIEFITRALTLSKNHPRMKAALAHAYAAAGRTEEARKILDELNAMLKEKYCPCWIDTALAYVALGEVDTAFEKLEKAYEERAALFVWLFPDPIVDPLRSDPRFHDLMRRIGIK